jgi:2,4-dienoyl-CoA reductase-like NADH-dependent reductase (Old Yellow Enzyme family)
LATNIDKSVIAQNLHGQVPREVTRSEIYDFIDAHFNGTMLAIQAGFDGVEIHCAHGYFGANFLSPNQNIRTDEFGGSFENRARYMRESVKACVKAIKFMHAEGRFVVGVRTSAEELMPGGLEMSDYVEIHKEAQRAGSSYVSLSWGAGFENMKYLFPSEDMMPPKVAHAKYFSENLDMPVIVSSLHNPDIAAEVTGSYKNVLVGLGRQAYADPDWPNKVKEGRIRDITRCLRCNLDCYCWSRILGLPERCAVNPELGFEGFNPDNWPKRRA